jgi:hypothetical protein
MQGSKSGDDFTSIVDSLKKGTPTTQDSTDTWDIVNLYGHPFTFMYLQWNDTGTSYEDSAKVYIVDEFGNKAQVQLQKVLDDSVKSVTCVAGATTRYWVKSANINKIEIVLTNAVYVAGQRGKYQIDLTD